MKQTAVEFLEKELNELLVLFSTKWDKVNKAIEQAKELEKQQIIDAWDDGGFGGGQFTTTHDTAEQYYNETFNK